MTMGMGKRPAHLQVPAIRVPGEALTHPVALIALMVVFGSDHLLRGPHPGWVTGGLSDVAVLIYFPLLLTAAYECSLFVFGRRWEAGPSQLHLATAFTALVFVTIHVFPAAGMLFEESLRAAWTILGSELRASRVGDTGDPTVLLAIPFLVVPHWIARSSAAQFGGDGTANLYVYPLEVPGRAQS